MGFGKTRNSRMKKNAEKGLAFLILVPLLFLACSPPYAPDNEVLGSDRVAPVAAFGDLEAETQPPDARDRGRTFVPSSSFGDPCPGFFSRGQPPRFAARSVSSVTLTFLLRC